MRVNIFYASVAVALLVMGFVGLEVLASLQSTLDTFYQTLTTTR